MTVLASSNAFAQSTDCPRTVTRGESQGGASRVLIDWLRCTFNKPVFTITTLISLLSDFMLTELRGIEAGKGLHGFKESVRIDALVMGEFKQIGYIAFGGASQKGRWMLDLSGSGCGLVKDWDSLQDLLESLEDARLTRVDIAADFLEGQKTVDDAVGMFEAGEFTMNGRPPITDTQGDWLTGERGRTLYVGKKANGKQLCIYEKGKQLGDLNSAWTRYELRLGNKDRELPFDVLTTPEVFFAGAYPALQSILDHIEGERIDTISKEAHIGIVSLMYHAKRCYGKLFSTMKTINGYDQSDFIEAITIQGLPNRLDPASLDANLSYERIKAGVEGFA